MEGTTIEKKPNSTKRRRRLAEPERFGRDEMNLAEFPIASLSDRLPPGIKTLVFEDETDDPLTRETVVRRLTVTGSDRYGLPTAQDDEIIVGLIQLTRRADFSSETVYFSRYELIRELGWSDEGKSYDRIELAINRWCGVTLYWDNAWWDKEEQAWVNVKFGILDNATILDKRRYDRKRKEGQVPLALSSFKWNEVIFRSFKAGNLRRLDMDIFRGLRSSVAKRMFRFLDKRFYFRDRLKFDLHEFAFEKIGLSRSYASNAAKIKEKLEPAIVELEAEGVLETLPKDERYVRVGKGHWDVVFLKKRGLTEDLDVEAPATTAPESTVAESLVLRGIGKRVAADLAARFSPQRIAEKIELHDFLLGKKDARIAKNAAGFLTAAIREDYALPTGFETKVQREEKAKARAKRELDAAEAARVERELAEHERALRKGCHAYWDALSTAEQAELEAKAIEFGDEEIVVKQKKAPVGKLADLLLQEIVFDYIVREGLVT